MTSGSAPAQHVPVMQSQVLHYLQPALGANSRLIDATLGLAGHSRALLERCPGTTLIGIDRDQQALSIAGERLAGFADRVHRVHAVYDQLAEVCAQLGVTEVQAILLDLGVSSLQLDRAERGFAYRMDAPLDMRMDPSDGPTAADVLNSATATELARIFRDYGEERFAGRIARAVVTARAEAPFTTSARLVDVIRAAIPAAARYHAGHPAKRVFQALRIEVNAELDALAAVLPAAVELLAVGGRIAVLSYHSLEDRLVKRAFAQGALSTTPVDLPVELPEHAPYLRLLTRGAELPAADEVELNPRAGSARLRVAERIRCEIPGGPR